MLTFTVLLALLGTNHFATAQVATRNPSCTAGLTYTASSISRTFDYCTGFAYGASFSVPSSPYPSNSALCVDQCTGSCVAANWVEGNNCQLAMSTVYFISTFSSWNPTWTAYVARQTPVPVTDTPMLQSTTSSSFPTSTALLISSRSGMPVSPTPSSASPITLLWTGPIGPVNSNGTTPISSPSSSTSQNSTSVATSVA